MEVFFINSAFSYAILPLNILSSDEKILYALLLNRINYSKKNLSKFCDSKGVFIYYSNSQIQNHLNCCENTATKALNNLEKIGLITKEYQKNGLPLKIYVKDIREKREQKAKPKTQETSFDIDRAISREQINRQTFGEKKNKRHRFSVPFYYLSSSNILIRLFRCVLPFSIRVFKKSELS